MIHFQPIVNKMTQIYQNYKNGNHTVFRAKYDINLSLAKKDAKDTPLCGGTKYGDYTVSLADIALAALLAGAVAACIKAVSDLIFVIRYRRR